MKRILIILHQVLIWAYVCSLSAADPVVKVQQTPGKVSFGGEVPVKGKVEWIRFLVTVDATKYKNCIPTPVLTPPLKHDQHWNATAPIVSSCDKGHLIYHSYPMMTEWKVRVTYYTTTIDIEPPFCDISLTGRYRTPERMGTNNTMLYGCYFNASREGYHPTDYWIYILDWKIKKE